MCPSCGSTVLEDQGNGEAASQASTPARHKTDPLPFDSLYQEYIPQSVPIYERNYAARPVQQNDPFSQKASPTNPQDISSATSAYSPHPTPAFSARFIHTSSNLPLIVEALLSLLLGVFGIGWLLIGETVTGILLLIGSAIFYLPLLVISYVLAYFSFGLSVLCTGPLALGAVFLNAFMLNKTLKRKRMK